MGQALPQPALRPFLGEDTPVLAAIFAAAIEELTGEDYSKAQQQAWASAAADEEQFGKRLGSGLTLVARRGYVGKQRNTVTVNGEWLANTTMQKTLGDVPAPGGPT